MNKVQIVVRDGTVQSIMRNFMSGVDISFEVFNFDIDEGLNEGLLCIVDDDTSRKATVDVMEGYYGSNDEMLEYRSIVEPGSIVQYDSVDGELSEAVVVEVSADFAKVTSISGDNFGIISRIPLEHIIVVEKY